MRVRQVAPWALTDADASFLGDAARLWPSAAAAAAAAAAAVAALRRRSRLAPSCWTPRASNVSGLDDVDADADADAEVGDASGDVSCSFNEVSSCEPSVRHFSDEARAIVVEPGPSMHSDECDRCCDRRRPPYRPQIQTTSITPFLCAVAPTLSLASHGHRTVSTPPSITFLTLNSARLIVLLNVKWR